jgi:hypothetical protein
MVSLMKHEITRTDIIPMEQYAKERRDRYRAITAMKQNRRMDIGPFATLYFENYDTMLFQVLEMLHIERGGEEQIAGELEAYNPLIPNGNELVATLMIEIGDAVRRAQVLATLGGIEETLSMNVGGEIIKAVAEADMDRTTAEGKASSVQFVHFPFTRAQVEAFRKPGAEIVVSVGHSGYRHMAVMPESVRAALADDFD